MTGRTANTPTNMQQSPALEVPAYPEKVASRLRKRPHERNPPMKRALILTLDMGTSSVRAMLFDAHGRALPDAEVQMPYAQRKTGDGGVEADAETLLELTVSCIGAACCGSQTKIHGRRLAGVGISCFWHSLVGVGDGQQRRRLPCIPGRTHVPKAQALKP